MQNQKKYLVGMMSGTSLDGIDSVICDNENYQIIGHFATEIPADLKRLLLVLNKPSENEIHLAKQAETELTKCYAQTFFKLIEKTKISSNEIIAIGAHGQTIRHCPNGLGINSQINQHKAKNKPSNKFDDKTNEYDNPYTIQLLNGAMLSYITKQNVVCDFRSKDIAAGGQGAPLAPIFHKAFFAKDLLDSDGIAVVNIGGIANISIINLSNQVDNNCDNPIGENVIGFDTGPGNCLLDEWVYLHKNQKFDSNGNWASSGKIQPTLLENMLNDNYFKLKLPKSTGRDYFNMQWLNKFHVENYLPEDVMRTLTALTSKTIANEIISHLDNTKNMNKIKKVIIAGGGANNSCLLDELRSYIPNMQVLLSDDFDINSQHLESLGFAYLADKTMKIQLQNTTKITGASESVILGCIYYHS